MNPLIHNKLRTAGLASVESAKFGMVRKNADGSPRPHQGIDLRADKGAEVFAIKSGHVVSTARSSTGYGNTITIKHGDIYSFYAHLSVIAVKQGDKVDEGQYIGKTGDSGNANGMNKISNGGHLHFEIRIKEFVGLGLAGRVDPLLYVELDA